MSLFNQKSNQKHHQWAPYVGAFFACFSTSALAIDWAWQLENATVFESVIAIQHADGSIGRHQFQCDLTDALNEKTEMSSTIEPVVPHSHPDGVLIVTCYRGEHAEMIAIIDPLENEVVYKKMGSYFVDWRLENGNIIIDYDTPCEVTKDNTCTGPNNQYVTVSQPWP